MLGSNQKYVIRYRPSFSKKAQLILRTRDMADTNYEHIKLLTREEVDEYIAEGKIHFLYPSEQEEYLKGVDY